jgi:hypothetical protein
MGGEGDTLVWSMQASRDSRMWMTNGGIYQHYRASLRPAGLKNLTWHKAVSRRADLSGCRMSW